MNSQAPVEARVGNVLLEQQYVVCHALNVRGPITFSINPTENIWKEKKLPLVGEHIHLTDIRLFDGGWRAFSACSIRP